MTFPSTQLTSPPQAQGEVIVNEAFETLEHQSVYGKRHAATSALAWGYYGGRWGGNSISDGTLTLTDAATNYVVVAKSGGAISVSTSSTNWNNTSDYVRVFKITTSGGAVTAVEDHRAGTGGVHGSSAAASSVGRHAIWIAAASMQPGVASGCAALAAASIGSGKPDIHTLDFDASSAEYAQFSIAMPASWDEGTVSFAPVWSHAAATTNFGVAWELQGVAVGNDDSIDAAFGTAQSSVDTGGTTSDLYQGPESSAITIAGSPAAEDVVFFRLARNPANGGDTLAIDARLHGIVLYITTAAATD